MKVADLESVIEGYQNAFDEELSVKIQSRIVSVPELTFDETFNNIAFKMTQQHAFSNPYQPAYHSALVNTTTQGVLTLTMNETLDM